MTRIYQHRKKTLNKSIQPYSKLIWQKHVTYTINLRYIYQHKNSPLLPHIVKQFLEISSSAQLEVDNIARCLHDFQRLLITFFVESEQVSHQILLHEKVFKI